MLHQISHSVLSKAREIIWSNFAQVKDEFTSSMSGLHQIDASSISSSCLTPISSPTEEGNGEDSNVDLFQYSRGSHELFRVPFPCLPFTSRIKGTDFIPTPKLWT